MDELTERIQEIQGSTAVPQLNGAEEPKVEEGVTTWSNPAGDTFAEDEDAVRASSEDDWSEEPESNEFAWKIWEDRPIVVAGGYTRETALKAAEKGNIIVAFGRNFLANVSLWLTL